MEKWLCVCAAAVAGCSGSGGNVSGVDTTGPPVATQSPGGLWRGVAGPNRAVSLFIAETGEMTVLGPGAAFGGGAVIVNDGNQAAGSYALVAGPPSGADAPSASERCELAGTVTERVSLAGTVRCTEANGSVTSSALMLAYDPAYDTGSSLQRIAGNYTLLASRQTNVLNINSNGVIFGMLDSGAVRCTVNGAVEIIDGRFGLYRFSLAFSGCQGTATRFTGATLTGLSVLDPAGAPGGLVLIVTGTIAARFEALNLAYERT